MLKHNLGFPRVGAQRELKRACENFWSGKISSTDLLSVASALEESNWRLQQDASMDLIPVNDFSLYDQVLDMTFLLGAIPERYLPLKKSSQAGGTVDDDHSCLELYFAMARGHQKGGLDVTPMEMTKWFDTNYHYIVPEFARTQKFCVSSSAVFRKFERASKLLGPKKNSSPKPVFIGPVSFLLLGKVKGEEEFDRLDLLPELLPAYSELLVRLQALGCEWVQLDEPYLSMDLTPKAKSVFQQAYAAFIKAAPKVKIVVATYFAGLKDNVDVAVSLPVAAIHVDLVRCPDDLDAVLAKAKECDARRSNDKLMLSLGVVDGRNVWKNDYEVSLALIRKAVNALGDSRVMLAPSCSLLHVPVDLELETDLPGEVKAWLSFAKQKLGEVADLCRIVQANDAQTTKELEAKNREAIRSHRESTLVNIEEVQQRVKSIAPSDWKRKSPFVDRQKIQRCRFNLPPFPTTTIGSFPQTAEIRQLRLKLNSKQMSLAEYEAQIEKATTEVIRWQEELGLDVLVHGEFERNDMVEFFGQLLRGFVFTKNGWVTSYGSRCVKPPIIFGDVQRTADMSVRWSVFAQAQTEKLMKGMLTGPVTILQWSFVRVDRPRCDTAFQLALAIREEVAALEKAGMKIIQIDEPAIREGLPLRRAEWDDYLSWAVKAFRIASSGVGDETQIHSHMCYSEFNDIIEHIASMDADVLTVESSRSSMELLKAFATFEYPNEIGPGVYDIHAARVPPADEMFHLLQKAAKHIPARNLWVNPDCGLKTRAWEETKQSLANMVQAAMRAREQLM